MEGTNYSLADLSAACGCNGGANQMNNPMWLLLALLFGFGGGGYGFGRGNGQGLQEAEIMAQLNSIRQTMSDNQNTNTLAGAVGSNHDLLHGIAGRMDMGFAGTAAAVNAASTANLLSQKDSSAQMASCCCDIKTNILNQTNQLQSRIDQLANGITQGFSAIAYENKQQTNELSNAINGSTQRILDKMCADTTQDLRDKLAQASQNAQTSYLISQLRPVATA